MLTSIHFGKHYTIQFNSTIPYLIHHHSIQACPHCRYMGRAGYHALPQTLLGAPSLLTPTASAGDTTRPLSTEPSQVQCMNDSYGCHLLRNYLLPYHDCVVTAPQNSYQCSGLVAVAPVSEQQRLLLFPIVRWLAQQNRIVQAVPMQSASTE